MVIGRPDQRFDRDPNRSRHSRSLMTTTWPRPGDPRRVERHGRPLAHAHDRKEIGRHARADQLHGFAGARQVEVAIEHHACHALERPRPRLPLGQFMCPTTLRGSSAPRRSQTITSRSGLREWERPQQDGIHDAEPAAVVAPMLSAISTMTNNLPTSARGSASATPA